MANDLVKSLAVHKDTFRLCRIYLATTVMSKEQVIKLEDAPIARTVPYYLNYLEYRQVPVIEAINYYCILNESFTVWEVILEAIVRCFEKLEKNEEMNFIPF